MENYTEHVKGLPPEKLKELDAQIAKLEHLRNERHDRRQSQQQYDGEEKRHGERRGIK
jgi:hypothetical protein